MAEPEYMTVGVAARRLGVSEPTVRNWSRVGRLPALRTSFGYRLFRREDVDRLAREREKAMPLHFEAHP